MDLRCSLTPTRTVRTPGCLADVVLPARHSLQGLTSTWGRIYLLCHGLYHTVYGPVYPTLICCDQVTSSHIEHHASWLDLFYLPTVCAQLNHTFYPCIVALCVDLKCIPVMPFLIKFGDSIMGKRPDTLGMI